MGKIVSRRGRGSVAFDCPTCSGEQVSEVLLGTASVLRCIDCHGLIYLQRRTVRSRMLGAVIKFCALTAYQTAAGTWVVFP